MTNSSGVATLTGVATTAGVGTDTGGVVASFAGDANAATSGTGNLVVSKAATALSQVFGNADFGGTAKLSATLKSSVTGLAIEGETVSFTLNNVAVGTAVTNSFGIATVPGAPTSAGVGTDAGAVVASFAGDTNFITSSGTGDLTVVQAQPACSRKRLGSADFGGTATLSATLTSTVTSLGIANETVTFTLNGVDVGTAITNNLGIATLPGVANSLPPGVHTGVVGVTFAGDTNYESSVGTGDLTVAQAPTSLSQVVGVPTSAVWRRCRRRSCPTSPISRSPMRPSISR